MGNYSVLYLYHYWYRIYSQAYINIMRCKQNGCSVQQLAPYVAAYNNAEAQLTQIQPQIGLQETLNTGGGCSSGSCGIRPVVYSQINNGANNISGYGSSYQGILYPYSQTSAPSSSQAVLSPSQNVVTPAGR